MNPKLDETHDPERTSWVDSANVAGGEFPVQNLPFGMFRRRGEKQPARPGVAIGDQILDLAAVATYRNLNELAAEGRTKWRALRQTLSRSLVDRRRAKPLAKFLTPMRHAELALPVTIGDFSDFYAGIHHAEAVGRIFRPDNPLLPNYEWVPIGYHGRASSVVVSGTPVVRPNGQTKAPDAPAPVYGPSRRLDFELELGMVIGTGTRLGKTVRINKALEHVFGVVMLNDWSARDVQAWEYQPLGPFLAKSFATTISPWIVTLDALAPFRCPAFDRDGRPAPLPYLLDTRDQRAGGFAIEMEMRLRSAKMRSRRLAPFTLTRSSFRHAYWTAAQMVTHQSSNGCNLAPGDLLGSGTISGPTSESRGSMLELTQGGKSPIQLPTGETRLFLDDGDQLVQAGRCTRDGHVSIGFGEAAGTIRPAPAVGRGR